MVRILLRIAVVCVLSVLAYAPWHARADDLEIVGAACNRCSVGPLTTTCDNAAQGADGMSGCSVSGRDCTLSGTGCVGK